MQVYLPKFTPTDEQVAQKAFEDLKEQRTENDFKLLELMGEIEVLKLKEVELRTACNEAKEGFSPLIEGEIYSSK